MFLSSAHAAGAALETVILTVSVNTISYGELFLKRNAAGQLLLRSSDLHLIGLKPGSGADTIVAGDAYVTVSNLTGVTAQLDERNLQLALFAAAAYVELPHIVRNYSPDFPTYTPVQESSAFINYRFDYSSGISSDNSSRMDSWNATGQGGVRRGNLLLLGDGIVQYDQLSQRAIRLQTALSWDRPAQLSRWSVGDISATAGENSGIVMLGGVSYGSALSLAPGLSSYPQGEFNGVVALPSEASIYVNKVLVRREHLAPGEYHFQHLPVANGSNNVEIIFRDAFGNESTSNNRFYLSDRLLRVGLHDYSYNIGVTRRNFGVESNNYAEPVLVGRHNYGFSDAVTVGGGFAADQNRSVVTPVVVFSAGQAGVVSLFGGASQVRELGAGSSVGASYQIQTRHLNCFVAFENNSDHYRTLTDEFASDVIRRNGSGGVSAGSSAFGTFGLSGAYRENSSGAVQRLLTLSYARFVTKAVQFTASVNQSWGGSVGVSLFAGLTFVPRNDVLAAVSVQSDGSTTRETVSLQKSVPLGEGIGYLAAVEHEQAGRTSVVRIKPLLQINGATGVYSADLQAQFNGGNDQRAAAYQLSAAGALLYAGGHLGLSRPVSSAFAVVQVGEVPDIKVLLDNQEVARTNAAGMAYLPDLRAYQKNRISFDDHQLPVNSVMSGYKTELVPGQYGGACVMFPLVTVQGYGGHVTLPDSVPLEFGHVTLHGTTGEFAFTTMSGGEFYFENMVAASGDAPHGAVPCGSPAAYHLAVVPGRYRAAVVVAEQNYEFELVIPESAATFIQLGILKAVEVVP
jgi:outer membrane usher protein